MKRRTFIALFGGAAVTWSRAARAQQPAKMKRIAIVNSAGDVSRISANGSPQFRALFEELTRFGLIEGQDFRVEATRDRGGPIAMPTWPSMSSTRIQI
jgi:putative tryptophan/tyrosine transport system substrate-binding protein